MLDAEQLDKFVDICTQLFEWLTACSEIALCRGGGRIYQVYESNRIVEVNARLFDDITFDVEF